MELVSDSNITTESSGSRLDVLTMQKSGRNSIGATAHRFGNSTDFLTFVNRDEVDVRMLMASQWIIPLFLAVTCLLLFLSWGVRQKRRKRRRGSVSSRLTNLVSQ
nr:unnamed protein product [Ananas comosus var. bracteatus]